jgi:aryl-alcohol dehydrogenase-like predicted oxidoreductase
MNESSSAAVRRLGTDGPLISSIGMGCWPIGGPVTYRGRLQGWPAVDEEEAIRALRKSFELGITFFDTADMYGAGLSERLIGRALGGVRDQIVISSKFGFRFDEQSRTKFEPDLDPGYIRQACDASLRRLGTDHLDLYLCHINACDPARAPDVLETLENLVASGKVRAIGWSTDELDLAEAAATSSHCRAIEHCFSVFARNQRVLDFCARSGLASIAHSPLAAGLLGGLITRNHAFVEGDIRNWIREEPGGKRKVDDWLTALEGVRDVLASGGRTLAQGAICWLWAQSPVLTPIPGFSSAAEAAENAGALAYGPLPADALRQIDDLLGGAPTDWIPFTSLTTTTRARG